MGRMPATCAAPGEALHDRGLALQGFQWSQARRQLVPGQVNRFELLTIGVFLEGNTFRTGLDGIKAVALENKNKARRPRLAFSIRQHPADHRREQYGASSQ